MQPKTDTRGFTLLELSVVLVIVGVIASMSFSTGITVLQTARLSQTQGKIVTLKQALLTYRKAWYRLPCPSSLTLATSSANFGIEGPNTANCIDGTVGNATATNINAGNLVVEGAIPTRTLKLPDDFAFDGWGNRIRYAVSTPYTVSNSFMTHAPSASCDASLQLKDASGSYRTQTAVYALISHGSNGFGAYNKAGSMIGTSLIANTDEKQNCHCNSGGATTYDGTYVQKAATQDYTNSLNSFDDITDYALRWQMQTLTDTAKKSSACATVYVADYNNHVQRFNALGVYQDTFSSSGTGAGQLTGPLYGIAVDASNNIWIADGQNTNGRIQEFSASGTYLGVFGSSGCNTLGKLCWPGGLAIDNAGNFWVGGGDQHFQKFNSAGTAVAQYGGWGATGSGNGFFNVAYAIAIDPNQNVWVVDQPNYRVEEFNSSGTFIRSIGGPSPHTCQTSPAATSPSCVAGTNNGQFSNSVAGIAADSNGNIYVADMNNNRIQKFDNSGTFLYQIGVSCTDTGTMPACVAGTADGQFNHPGTVAVDGANNLWVADTSNYRIQEFDSSGNFILKFGSHGVGTGQFGNIYNVLVVWPTR